MLPFLINDDHTDLDGFTPLDFSDELPPYAHACIDVDDVDDVDDDTPPSRADSPASRPGPESTYADVLHSSPASRPDSRAYIQHGAQPSNEEFSAAATREQVPISCTFMRVVLKCAIIQLILLRDRRGLSYEDVRIFMTSLRQANGNVDRSDDSINSIYTEVRDAIYMPVQAYFQQLPPGARPSYEGICAFLADSGVHF